MKTKSIPLKIHGPPSSRLSTIEQMAVRRDRALEGQFAVFSSEAIHIKEIFDYARQKHYMTGQAPLMALSEVLRTVRKAAMAGRTRIKLQIINEEAEDYLSFLGFTITRLRDRVAIERGTISERQVSKQRFEVSWDAHAAVRESERLRSEE